MYKKLYVGYLVAGHQGLEKSFLYAAAMIEGGVNVLEIGMPFSDPIADGEVIQAAMHNALSFNITLEKVLLLAKRIKESFPDVVLILFTYLNPLFQAFPDYDFKSLTPYFSGLLIVDCPYEESEMIVRSCDRAQLFLVTLITPSTALARLPKLLSQAKGFIYYVCRKGITGVSQDLPADFGSRIQAIRTLTSLPIVAGFGISSKEMISTVLKYTDGFVIGSLFVNAMNHVCTPGELKALVSSLQPLEEYYV